MSYYLSKTPLLGPGIAWCMTNLVLTQVKSHRGLTSFIEKNGVNGKFLNPEKPYNMRLSKFLKILAIKARYQTDDEFLEEWHALGEHLLTLVRIPNHLIHFL